MLIFHVFVHVTSGSVKEFQLATAENAANSIKEAGIARFDVLQSSDDPTRFLLVEVYRDAEAPAKHKETSHYRIWSEKVAPMMAEPRSRAVYTNVFPADESW